MNQISRRLFVQFLPALLLVSTLTPLAHAAPVLMISIDGLKPEYITQADAHGMKIPYLRTLLRDGRMPTALSVSGQPSPIRATPR